MPGAPEYWILAQETARIVKTASQKEEKGNAVDSK
jgi:hypothetical protein